MRNISVRGKEGDRDLVYYSATTRYYAITMHFKRKVIVFSSSWRFLLNLSNYAKHMMMNITETQVDPCTIQNPCLYPGQDILLSTLGSLS